MHTPLRLAVLIGAIYSGGTIASPTDGAPSSTRTLPEVLVEAAREPAYQAEKATVAGKLPQSPREIPNSVSVLTRQQMDDQNMVTPWDALSQITGVQAVANDITQGQFHSRGGALEVQQDGLPSTLPLSGYQQFDLALYERVEVMRGPAGLLQGSGSFSGAVNFVRKRPKDAFAASALASTGTWNNNRLEADVSAVVNESRSLRARGVLSVVDRDYVFNRVHDRKWLGYLTVDYDFSPATTFNLFVANLTNDSTGFSGLPTYTDGRQLSVPRSFNPYPDWIRIEWDTTDIGADLSHRFGDRWTATLKLQRRDQSQFFKDGYANAGVNPATNVIASYARREFIYDYVHEAVDAYAGGPFSLFGREHNVLVGANFSSFDSRGRGANPNSPGSSSLTYTNVLLADPPAVPEPEVTYRTGSHSVTTQTGLYGRLTLNLADPLKLILGGRFSDYTYKSRTTAPNPTPTAWARGARAEGEFTPYAGLTWDVSRQLTLYASYADIFVPQTQKRVDNSVLDPRVGRQYEIGAKAGLLDQRLSVNASVFNIRDTNRALADTVNPGYFTTAGELESKGRELELVGQIMPRWDVSAGYTWMDTRWVNNGASTGLPVSFWYPKELLKLWSRYRFADSGPLRGFSIGFGLQGQGTSASGAATPTVAARTQNAYTVYKLQVGYAIDRNWSATLDVNNVFDSDYYTRLGGTNTYNFYGDPRNVVLTLRARY